MVFVFGLSFTDLIGLIMQILLLKNIKSHFMNLILSCLLATFYLNNVGCSNNIGALSDKTKVQHLWGLNALTKLGTNPCNSLKESKWLVIKVIKNN